MVGKGVSDSLLHFSLHKEYRYEYTEALHEIQLIQTIVLVSVFRDPLLKRMAHRSPREASDNDFLPNIKHLNRNKHTN